MSGAIVVGDVAAPTAAAPASTSSAAASPSSAGTGPWPIAAGTAAALGLIGLGVLIARRRRPAAI
ncbi:MAG: hypothetical protein M3067_02585 [Chloroflexota bacterium]|nr:hypothetical protein [Chloroflexota bacterium]